MSINRAPAALPPPHSGDPSFDEAAALIQARFNDDDAPEVARAFKRLHANPQPGDDARLAGLFVPELLELGRQSRAPAGQIGPRHARLERIG